MYPTPIPSKRKLLRTCYGGVVIFVVFVWLLPLLAVALTSLRTLAEINQGQLWTWPRTLEFYNYVQVFIQTDMARYLLNSLIITVPAVMGAIILATLAGFSLAKHRFFGSNICFAIFVGGNFVPYQILAVPVRNLSLSLHIYNSYSAIILFHIAFQTGFAVLFMRNFIAELPDEILEAARIDGVSEWRIFRFIVVPLTKPAIAALTVLLFTFVWNDYFWALVLVQGSNVLPVTTGLQALLGEFVASWQLVSAAAIIAALPPVIMFFAMQRYFISGLTLGATKG